MALVTSAWTTPNHPARQCETPTNDHTSFCLLLCQICDFRQTNSKSAGRTDPLLNRTHLRVGHEDSFSQEPGESAGGSRLQRACHRSPQPRSHLSPVRLNSADSLDCILRIGPTIVHQNRPQETAELPRLPAFDRIKVEYHKSSLGIFCGRRPSESRSC
jgi:hypothetical protein